jgi:hypothetical protein
LVGRLAGVGLEALQRRVDRRPVAGEADDAVVEAGE